ncbi:coiled-coil domain-containing protein [Ornithinibacillus contaminans]|uniref:hypothetical protein n=1 Tax=Ornithinibacillus contaminans TaxID=694055 RepID=UPI00064DA205|nr:hypothetical protein [Ornithinibacillus contaminans]
MKTKRKHRRWVYIGFILIGLLGSIAAPFQQRITEAADAVEATSENSGGFIIETEKVDGSMDLVGALTGNITIWEGNISGLTITKVLERGEGLEPLVIKINASGPIPVKNLNAKTVNHELPNIGGLCEPGQLGWICMENVVMNVEAQFVENISLSGATIETCYGTECGALPEYNSLISKEELEQLLNGSEDEAERDKQIKEIIDLIEEQENNLSELKGLLTTVLDRLNELQIEDYTGTLLEKIAEVNNAIMPELGIDQILPSVDAITTGVEELQERTASITEDLGVAEEMLAGTEKMIPEMETILAEMENLIEEQAVDQEQLDVYIQLSLLAKQQEAGETIDATARIAAESEKEAEELQAIHERISMLKEELKEQKEDYKQLKTSEEELIAEQQKVEKEVNGLESLLDELNLIGLDEDEESSDKDLVEDILDPVEENVLDPVEENILDPIEENILDPVEDNVLNPIKEGVLNPLEDQVLNPVKENLLDPVLDPVNENILNPVKESILDPVTDTILNPLGNTLLNPLGIRMSAE